MSRWRPEPVSVTLSPGAVEVRCGVARAQEILQPDSHAARRWQAALESLQQHGAAMGLTPQPGWRQPMARLRWARPVVRLSADFVRFVVLPASRGHLDDRGLEDLARAMVSGQHGSDWADAILRISPGLADEGVLVAAVPANLQRDLAAVLQQLGLADARICPLLVDQAERIRTQEPYGRRICVASIEKDWLVMAVAGVHGWESVRALRVVDAVDAALHRELARERMLLDEGAVLPVHVCVHGVPSPSEADSPPDVRWVHEGGQT